MNQRLRVAVLQRDGYACVYCGRRPPEVVLEADHVWPKSMGGVDLSTNLVTACRDCNGGKSDTRLPLPPGVTPQPIGLVSRLVNMVPTAAEPPTFFRWCADQCPECGMYRLPVAWLDGDTPVVWLGYRCRCGFQWTAGWDPAISRIHADGIKYEARKSPAWLQ